MRWNLVLNDKRVVNSLLVGIFIIKVVVLKIEKCLWWKVLTTKDKS
jgi:hypothetical protein